MRYLDPKADLTFKLVFGEHPDLVMSLLNALLPLKEGEDITEIEYLAPEMVPENPLRKDSIVDVRCRDYHGRQFIVEMQMVWSPEFYTRVLFNASKAYVRQLKPDENYDLLQPVYSLNLINDVFEPNLSGYYHHYSMIHVEHSDRVIKGLELVFVELPKFVPTTFSEKKMQVLWLRYLTEIKHGATCIPSDLLEVPELRKAVRVLEESSYTDDQLMVYERFWDIINVERILYRSGWREGREEGREEGKKAGREEGREEGGKAGREEGKREGLEEGRQEGRKVGLEEGRQEGREEGRKVGLEEGRQEGREKGREEGLQEGEKQKQWEIARRMKADGVATDVIVRYTGLTFEEMERL